MGVPVRVILYAADEEQALAASNAVWKRFDELNATLSDYDPESEIIQSCRKSAESGGFVEVSPDLRLALEESRKFCEWTGGAFDATVSPIVKLWRRSRYFHSRPPESALLSAKKLVGLDVWTIDERGVKTEPNVRFDVGGIAKGIALDEALKAAQNLGVKSVLVDASGDLRLGAAPPGKKGWKIGVASLNSEPACYCEFRRRARQRAVRRRGRGISRNSRPRFTRAWAGEWSDRIFTPSGFRRRGTSIHAGVNKRFRVAFISGSVNGPDFVPVSLILSHAACSERFGD